jgi:hypothetical protein
MKCASQSNHLVFAASFLNEIDWQHRLAKEIDSVGKGDNLFPLFGLPFPASYCADCYSALESAHRASTTANT